MQRRVTMHWTEENVSAWGSASTCRLRSVTSPELTEDQNTKKWCQLADQKGRYLFAFFFCTLPTNSSTDIRISHEEHMSHVRNRKESRLMTEPHQLDPSEQNGSLFNHNTFRSAHTQTLLHTQTLGLKKQQIISCQQIWLQKYSGTTNAKLFRREQFCLNRLPNSRCSFLL